MPKILIIDDDSDYIAVTSAILVQAGHTTLSAHSGEEGYQTAVGKQPDLIILDAMMAHETDGFDTARKLREDPSTKAIPIIMVTGIRIAQGLISPPSPHERWLPVDRVLEKPVDTDVLLSAIDELTHGQVQQRDSAQPQ